MNRQRGPVVIEELENQSIPWKTVFHNLRGHLFYLFMKSLAVDLIRNVLHEIRYLNTQCLIGGTVGDPMEIFGRYNLTGGCSSLQAGFEDLQLLPNS